MTPLTPEEFEKEMQKIKKQHEDDPEACHARMDQLMARQLRQLGYGEGIDVWIDTPKWYA